MAVQLRNRISFLTGKRFSATVVLDQPSLQELTAHVYAALAEELPAIDETAELPTTDEIVQPSRFDFASLYYRVFHLRGAREAAAMRVHASAALPSFGAADRAAHAVAPARLSAGNHGPMLIYLPSYMALISPRRLAATFKGRADVVMLGFPGIHDGGAVPDGVDTLALMLADSVRQVVRDRPFALVGYCAGGNVAHAVAGELCLAGLPPPASFSSTATSRWTAGTTNAAYR